MQTYNPRDRSPIKQQPTETCPTCGQVKQKPAQLLRNNMNQYKNAAGVIIVMDSTEPTAEFKGETYTLVDNRQVPVYSRPASNQIEQPEPTRITPMQSSEPTKTAILEVPMQAVQPPTTDTPVTVITPAPDSQSMVNNPPQGTPKTTAKTVVTSNTK
jgi:hypothetical protein